MEVLMIFGRLGSLLLLPALMIVLKYSRHPLAVSSGRAGGAVPNALGNGSLTM
jgi:hypothetical protein